MFTRISINYYHSLANIDISKLHVGQQANNYM